MKNEFELTEMLRKAEKLNKIAAGLVDCLENMVEPGKINDATLIEYTIKINSLMGDFPKEVK